MQKEINWKTLIHQLSLWEKLSWISVGLFYTAIVICLIRLPIAQIVSTLFFALLLSIGYIFFVFEDKNTAQLHYKFFSPFMMLMGNSICVIFYILVLWEESVTKILALLERIQEVFPVFHNINIYNFIVPIMMGIIMIWILKTLDRKYVLFIDKILHFLRSL